jgi:hypothetical protein
VSDAGLEQPRHGEAGARRRRAGVKVVIADAMTMRERRLARTVLSW